MNLYNQTFFNRRNWILENLQNLNLTLQEGLMVLVIDYFNEFNKMINIQSLSEKMKLDGKETDEILNSLIQKGYLSIEVAERKMKYSLEGLFIHKENSEPCDTNEYKKLFDLYEKEFSRPLSVKEQQMLSEWITTYEFKLIEYALREAIIHNTLNFNYIDRILVNWKNTHLTAKMYEERNK